MTTCTCTYHVGDVFDVMATMPDGSVDLILTSPPFLALRSYLPPGHPDKAKEIGSEPNPAAFIDTLLRLTAEWRRLLAPHGTLAVELGDTYAGGAVGWHDDPKGSSTRAATGQARFGAGWPLTKSLCLIPELYRIALVYGMNPLTGEQSPAGRWRARNVVRWVRPNPPVGALGDKFRPATSDLAIACTSPKRWFDLDAVRTEHKYDPAKTTGNGYTKGKPEGDGHGTVPMPSNPAGAPPLDWWEIPPGGYQGSHYAVFPPELCVRPVKAMCPAEVCRTCGEPRRRIVERNYEHKSWSSGGSLNGLARQPDRIDQQYSGETVGWSDCGHGSYRPGRVLDPFGGSGTTGLVATGHGREAWLIDLDERNADLARERLGMFLTVNDTRKDRTP